MKAWVRRIDLETFQSELIALDPRGSPLTVGREGDIAIKSDRLSKRHCALVSEGGQWLVEDLTSTGGTFVNGRRVHGHPLIHGDTLWLYDALLVFRASLEARHPELEGAIDLAPANATAIDVYADWLLEAGDATGEHLRGKVQHGPAMLEGLYPLLREGRLELEWERGLIHTARIRCINDATYSDVELVARLLSLRIARWVRELTIDLSTWVVASANRIQQDAAAVLKGLSQGPVLPCLERLSFGYFNEPLPPSSMLPALFSRARGRLPRLATGAGALIQHARHAALELVSVPAGFDFHSPHLRNGAIDLEAGVWVGSATPGQLRALAPGTPRSTTVQSFLIRQQAPQWCLIPLEDGVLLNGRPATETRLLPGDVIDERNGVRFRFSVR